MKKIYCKACGFANKAQSLFCSTCGHNLNEQSSFSNPDDQQIYSNYLLEVKALFGEYQASKKKSRKVSLI